MARLDCIKDKFDERDYLMRAYLPVVKLPKKIDWAKKMSPVRDQGKDGVCVGFAAAGGMKEYQELLDYEKLIILSPRFLYNEGIVGLAMDKTITGELTKQAFAQAVLRRNPDKGLIYHSDRGSQYASNDFKALLIQNEFVGSMSNKGDCWDNAVAESFFHTLKVELIHRIKFMTREEAKRKIFEYIEMYYNTKRAHSTLGYLNPWEYENRKFSLNN